MTGLEVGLGAEHSRVFTVADEKFFVRSAFGDGPVFDNENDVGKLNGLEAVGDNEDRLVPEQLLKRSGNGFFAQAVESAGGLVEKKDVRIL